MGGDAPLAELATQLRGRVLVDPADTAPFLVDWRGRYHGRARAVVQPADAEDVAQTVRWCVAHRVPVVPQGGNTGLSGGATPDASGAAIVLSLARMRRVRALDPINDTVTVDAGCTLAQVQQAAAGAGRLFPLSLASEGSCTIGGNLSTNAGGTQVLRYGNARALCLGLEVVTADGELWNGLRGLRKDNTGYDLRDLFIGAEGTLGVITGATLQLHPRPAAQVTAIAAVDGLGAALALLQAARAALGPALTAFEVFSERCLQLVLRHFPACRRPLATPSPWWVLLEASDAESEAHAQQRFGALLERALEAGAVADAAVAASIADGRAFWALRENISEAQAAEGRNIKHDVSVPISAIADFVADTDARLAAAFPGVRMVTFGHLGDGNLHYNVSPAEGDADPASQAAFLELQPAINALVHERVNAFGGSVSAEHGLGQLRRDEAARYKPAVELALMRRIKQALDPLGLMNPGKVLG